MVSDREGKMRGKCKGGLPLQGTLHPNILTFQMWDRMAEVGPELLFQVLGQWSASMERWQRKMRELWKRVVELEKEVKGKGKEKRKEDAEEE